MSEIQRYIVDAFSKHDWSLEQDNFGGDLVKYDDHAAIVAHLEADIAEARKDQARYCETVKLYISGDLPLQLDTAESKKEFDQAIDAAIKEQGE